MDTDKSAQNDMEQRQYIQNMMILMFIMGFQGGTVHQCAEYLGTTTDDILSATPGRMEDLMRQAQIVRNKRNSPAYPVTMAAYTIESAPMDGTQVIVMLFGDDGTMRWASKARYGRDRGDRYPHWYDGMNERLIQPTHWIPIPKVKP